MELEKVKIELVLIGKKLSLTINRVECYLFGSIVSSPEQANDVDILILYDNEGQIRNIRQEFNALEHQFPVHMNYFTFEEDKELDFSSGQKAQMIFVI